MKQIKDVLRLRYEAKLSQRQVARSLKMGLGTVSLYLNRAKAANLSWPLPPDMDDPALERALFPNLKPATQPGYVTPDFATIHQELKRKGVTKQLLWEEYKQVHGDRGYQYSQFCHRYSQWAAKQKRSMRQVHKAGEKLFVDYSGQTVPVVNPDTGELRNAEIFVAALGASGYTYVEATWSQKKSDWIQSHVNALHFFGGVPTILVPDNLKSAVTKACRYEPVLNESYRHMAQHYGTTIIPARPKKPKDKPKAEASVLLAQRWILARLRHQTFFTLASLNQSIRFLLDDLNQRPFKKLPGSRLSQFELLDKPALQPLPKTPYQYTEFKLARVNIDYHVEFEKSYYSVPHHLVKHQVEIQATRESIAAIFKGKQVARHPRSHRPGSFTTDSNHMPHSHRQHQTWSPERLMQWAKRLGPDILTLVQAMLERKRHPEQAYRACLGLLNLSRQYDAQRLNQACARALAIGSPTVRSVKSILQRGMDQLDLRLNETKQQTQQADESLPHHDNIRGPQYYH